MINKSNIAYVIMIVIVILICTFLAMLEYQNEETHICKVEDKWVKRSHGIKDYFANMIFNIINQKIGLCWQAVNIDI